MKSIWIGLLKFKRNHRDCGNQEVFEYELKNGDRIKDTKDHKFMTTGEMLAIDEIFERGLDLAITELYCWNQASSLFTLISVVLSNYLK